MMTEPTPTEMATSPTFHNQNHNHARETREWETVSVNTEIIHDIEIQCKTRLDPPTFTINDKLYQPIKYQLVQTITLNAKLPFVLAKIHVVDANSNAKILKNNAVPLKGVTEGALTPNGRQDMQLTCNMKIQFEINSYHYDGRQFKLQIEYFANSDLVHPVLVKRSPAFTVYARKPYNNTVNHGVSAPRTATGKRKKETGIGIGAAPTAPSAAPQQISGASTNGITPTGQGLTGYRPTHAAMPLSVQPGHPAAFTSPHQPGKPLAPVAAAVGYLPLSMAPMAAQQQPVANQTAGSLMPAPRLSPFVNGGLKSAAPHNAEPLAKRQKCSDESAAFHTVFGKPTANHTAAPGQPMHAPMTAKTSPKSFTPIVISNNHMAPLSLIGTHTSDHGEQNHTTLSLRATTTNTNNSIQGTPVALCATINPNITFSSVLPKRTTSPIGAAMPPSAPAPFYAPPPSMSLHNINNNNGNASTPAAAADTTSQPAPSADAYAPLLLMSAVAAQQRAIVKTENNSTSQDVVVDEIKSKSLEKEDGEAEKKQKKLQQSHACEQEAPMVSSCGGDTLCQTLNGSTQSCCSAYESVNKDFVSRAITTATANTTAVHSHDTLQAFLGKLQDLLQFSRQLEGDQRRMVMDFAMSNFLNEMNGPKQPVSAVGRST